MQWDPEQYLLFADERARPFHDLLARVGATGARRVVDLGCGPGTLTRLLAQRWPQARVEAVDSSYDMVRRAEGELRDLGERAVPSYRASTLQYSSSDFRAKLTPSLTGFVTWKSPVRIAEFCQTLNTRSHW